MAALDVRVFALCSLSMLIIGVSGSSADAIFRDELLARIQSLEHQGGNQADKIQQMEIRLEDQQERLVRQEITIHEYKQRVAVLEQTVAELQRRQHPDLSGDSDEPHDSDQSRDSDEAQDNTVGKDPGLRIQLRSLNTMGSKEAVRQRRMLVDGPVAFHSVIKNAVEKSHIGIGQKIVFPDVMINLGGGYHNLHGIFIAPQPGIYFFSTSIMSWVTAHPEIVVSLMKNGSILARAYAHGDSGRHDQGSVTVVTQLAAGDEVWVSLYGPADTSLYGNSYDSFTGCLVVPI